MPPAEILRAQVLLSRAHFSVGEINGVFGNNTAKALAAFQSERELPVTRHLDAATWAALNEDTAPALIDYTVTAHDAAGPFLPVPRGMHALAKRSRLGYASLLEALGEQAHASPGLLKALNPAARFQRAGEKLRLPNVPPSPPGRAARVEISRSESSVRAYDAEDRLLAYYPATMGSAHDPLPLGHRRIDAIIRNPVFHYNPRLFWDAKAG